MKYWFSEVDIIGVELSGACLCADCASICVFVKLGIFVCFHFN